MSILKKDAIIKLHRDNKTPEEIQAVINILFAEEVGYMTVPVIYLPFYLFLIMINLIKNLQAIKAIIKRFDLNANLFNDQRKNKKMTIPAILLIEVINFF